MPALVVSGAYVRGNNLDHNHTVLCGTVTSLAMPSEPATLLPAKLRHAASYRRSVTLAKHSHTVTLVVRSADEDDVYKDIVRIPQIDRGSLKTGRLHKVSWQSGSALLVLRGLTSDDDGKLRIDEESRSRLGVKFGDAVEFTIKPVGIWGEFEWAWNATDPAYRVASRLGLIGLILGAVGTALGVWSLVLALKAPC